MDERSVTVLGGGQVSTLPLSFCRRRPPVARKWSRPARARECRRRFQREVHRMPRPRRPRVAVALQMALLSLFWCVVGAVGGALYSERYAVFANSKLTRRQSTFVSLQHQPSANLRSLGEESSTYSRIRLQHADRTLVPRCHSKLVTY